MEIRFSLTSEGKILSCNKNGQILADRFGNSFLDFFDEQFMQEAMDYLKSVTESSEVIPALLHDRLSGNGVGTLYNGFCKNGTLFLAGFQTQLMTRLASELVHELRNPLTVIKGFFQLSSLTQDFYKYQGVIMSEIDRMHLLLESFLKSCKNELKTKPVLPDKLSSQLIALMASECTMRRVPFDYDVAFSENACNVDISMIKQVILNLTRNALDAVEALSGRTGQLFFRGTIEPDGYRFAVEDNGIGIENHVLKKMGQPFFTTKSSGNGIGLSLSKKIVAEHGGSFCMSSVPGHGTTISFLLPFAS
ncbi:sensor histidine kinase [Sporolactobacillus vineae]|uniref:sensor histidine kinase n=1 Tax=Sporolactobacillus vineae TaxID=444463 RepID=UPI000288E9C6|nr:HAMP domain-containing sensor histidine kinase [Sporolactobacillus vineae]